MTYCCPVCGFDLLAEPPQAGNICPCCGTEFGYDDDMGVTFEQLREQWIQRGTPWFSRAFQPPANWDARKQLRKFRYAAGHTVVFSKPSTVGDVVVYDFSGIATVFPKSISVGTYDVAGQRLKSIEIPAAGRRVMQSNNSTEFVQTRGKEFALRPRVTVDHIIAAQEANA